MLRNSLFGEDLFDEFFNDFPFYGNRDAKKIEKQLYGHRAKDMMKTDIREKNDAYLIEIDLPGFKKEEIKVSLEKGYLTVSAARGLDKDEQNKEDGRYIRRERYAGACERTFYIGDTIRQEDIRAEFAHGILTLTVPKKSAKAVEENKYISIEG